MANVKWSAFPSGTTIGATDVTVGLQGGADVQWTMAQMKTWTSASPLLVTPALGTPSSGTLTSCTGLPISTGVSGLGTGVATALAVNVGSAGAFVAFNGALGTPSSGTATNLTGLPLTSGVTGVLPVANGGTNASSASITAFNNITGYTAAGATGTTSTNLVFSTSPMLVTPVLGAATGTSLSVTAALTAYSGTAIPAGGTAGSGIKFSSTANFGVFFGSGAPTLAAAQGAIYLRSDGTSSTGVYTNTDGSTTWAAIGGGGGGLTVGTTTIASGTTTRILYDNAGTLGEYTITGSGTVVAMQTSPSLVTPALGVATATSLAVNGATIGSNALAVTGLTALSRKLTITQGTADESILASTGYSVTGSGTTSMVDLAGTWNTSGAPTAIKLNVTNTASSASSLLMDLQVGGTSQFKVDRSGNPTFVGSLVTIPNAGQIFNVSQNAGIALGSSVFTLYGSGGTANISISGATSVILGSTQNFGFSSSSNPVSAGIDTFLTRSAAATLQLGAADAASPVAQTLQVQSVVAGTADTGGGNWTLKASKSTGAGTPGDIIFQTSGKGAASTTVNTLITALTIKGGTTNNTTVGQPSIVIGNAAIATNATDGFLYITTCAGTPTGTPTTFTGRVALCYDTTNHQLWVYDGGWLQPKTPAAAATVTWQ